MSPRCFQACFILTSCLVAGKSPKYALKGQEVFLKPNIKGEPDGILWKHNGDKVVEFNGNEEHVYSPYEKRITLGWDSAELNITDLRFEDSGDYELEVYMNKGFQPSLYKLEVIDKVPKPTISCEMNNGSGSNISGKLVCSAEPRRPQSLIKFEWISHGNVQPGPQLPIPLGEKHDDIVYSCHVSNPLSNETATFTAKNCYPDKSSVVALIASLVSILAVGLLVAVLFCKLRHKACFAKDDMRKQSPPGTTDGSAKKQAHGDENWPLLDRAPTLPSNQPLRHLGQGNVQKITMEFEQHIARQTSKNLLTENITDKHKNTVSPRSPLRSDPPSSLDQNNLASNDKSDVGEDQLREPTEEKVPQYDPSDSEKANQTDATGVSDDLSEDTQSDRSIAPEQTELEMEEDEDEEAQFGPASAETSPAAQPCSLLTESSPNMDTTGEHKEDTDSDLSIAPELPEPEKEEDEDEEAQSAPASVKTSPAFQPRSPLTKSSSNTAPKDSSDKHKEDANSDQDTAEKNVRETDSSGKGERNESDDSSKDKHLSTVPEQKGSESALHGQDLQLSQEETHTRKDNQQEIVKPLSEDDNETESVGDHEEMASKQPQSPTPTKPVNRNTEFPDAAHADPIQEDNKTSHHSDESEGQSEKDEGETVEDKNEFQSGLKEEKPGNESCCEDKEGQKKDCC